MVPVIVDRYFKTSNKNIYAIGDVINRVQLTPVAIAEAMLLSIIFLKTKKKVLIMQIYRRQFFLIQTLHLLV